jgi:phage terminase Nu1 subunit (DNA packaging protein)
LSESTELSILSKLDELETLMNNLNNEAKTRIEELKNLETLAKELEMTDAANILNKQIREIERIAGEIDSKLYREINEMRIKEQIESKIKTASSETEDLKTVYVKICNDLTEIIRERNKIKLKNRY